VFVEVHDVKNRQDHLAGRIIWNGQKLWVEPPGDLMLTNLLEVPVPDGRGGEIKAAEDPAGFLWALHRQCRSAYLRVSEPQEKTAAPPG
jgi:hypothetical protein